MSSTLKVLKEYVLNEKNLKCQINGRSGNHRVALLWLSALKRTSTRSTAVEAGVPPPTQKLSVAVASIVCSRGPRRGRLPHLTHAGGCHGDPRNNHLGDAYGCGSLGAEKSKLSGMTLTSIQGWVRVRVIAKSELV